jgi:hypothetical protein
MKTLTDFLADDPCRQFKIEKDRSGQDIEDKGLGKMVTFDEGADMTKKARKRSREIAEESSTLQNQLNVSPTDSAKWNKQFEQSKCYFLSFEVIQKFIGIPGIDGLRLYKGLTEDNKEVLLVVAATNYKGMSFDIFQYEYTFYDDKVEVPKQDAPIIALNPCPPPNPCPHLNRFNS